MRRTPLMFTAALAVLVSTAACGGDPSAPEAAGTTDGTAVLETVDPTTPAPAISATPTPAATAAEDCFTYDAQVLLSRYEAGVHVILPDHGSELIRVYGGPGDVVRDKALAVARLFNRICYIGRGNSFDSPEFVYEYWQEPSGATASPLLYGDADCVHYRPRDLRVESLGAGHGWRVTNGTIDLQHFATEADANRGREAIGRQDMLCYVETRTPSPGDVTADITYTFNSGD